jgi:hypothetical protein
VTLLGQPLHDLGADEAGPSITTIFMVSLRLELAAREIPVAALSGQPGWNDGLRVLWAQFLW